MMPPRIPVAVAFFFTAFALAVQGQVPTPFEEEKLKATIAASQDPIALENAFRALISGYLERGDCDQAQEWLNRSREKRSLRPFASYLLEIGHCLEKKSPERARHLYQRVIVDYPDEKDEIGDSYSDAARRRLVWLSDDRSWVTKTPGQLIRVLTIAVKRRDFGSLRKYVSKVNFFFGACQSEFLNSDLNEIAAFMEENYAANIWVSRRLQKFPFQEGWYTVESRGWGMPYNYIYFLMQRISGGWEWIGALYCDDPIRSAAGERRQ